MIDQVAHLVVLHIRFCDELGLRIIQRDACVIFLGQDLICLFVHICTSSLVGRLSCLIQELVKIFVLVEYTLCVRSVGIEVVVHLEISIRIQRIPGSAGHRDLSCGSVRVVGCVIDHSQLHVDANLSQITLNGGKYSLVSLTDLCVDREAVCVTGLCQECLCLLRIILVYRERIVMSRNAVI